MRIRNWECGARKVRLNATRNPGSHHPAMVVIATIISDETGLIAGDELDQGIVDPDKTAPIDGIFCYSFLNTFGVKK